MNKIFAFVLMMFMMLSLASAASINDLIIDNSKDNNNSLIDDITKISKVYDYDSKTVTLKSSILFIPTGKVATIQLLTPLENRVGSGYKRVIEYNITGGSDLDELFYGETKTYDKVKFDNGDRTEEEKVFDWKYLEKYEVEEYIFEYQNLFYSNGSNYTLEVKIGSHWVERERWIDWDKSVKKIKKYESLIVGLYTNNTEGEYIEFVPTFEGIKIEEWASYLVTDLVSYYKLDDSSSVTVIDSHGSNTGTVTGATHSVSGIINTAYDFDGTDDYITLTDIDNVKSINLWINIDWSDINYDSFIQDGYSTAGGIEFRTWGPGTSQINVDFYISNTRYRIISDTISTGWHMATFTHDGTNGRLYIDGIINKTLSGSGTLDNTNNAWVMGANGESGGARKFLNGKLDEVGIWVKTLNTTEISELYASGVGNPYPFAPSDLPPTVIINNPANNTNYTTSVITFNGTAYDDINLVNVSLILDGSYNETNTSGINNSNYIFTKTIADGTHTFIYEACDDANLCTNTTSRTFNIDSVLPVITILYPIATNYNIDVSQLNYIATDINLDNCWYSTNGGVTNSTHNDCSTNFTGITSIEGSNTWILYSNDTFGNENSDSVNFNKDTINPLITIITPTSTNKTIAKQLINISASDTNLDTVLYDYNGTNYTYTIPINITFEDGTYTLIAYVNDTYGNANQTSVTFSIDVNAPEVNITYPNGQEILINYFNQTYPELDLNWTISDINLDSCWYYYNDTNVSVTCNSNTTTFQTNENNKSITMWANDTFGFISSDTKSWTYLIGFENTTSFNESCLDDNINWTDFPDGEYEFDVTTCDTYDRCNTTVTRTVFIDTTFPNISYAPNSDATDISANFSVQDWIFVNVTVAELNEKNITFNLWNSTDTLQTDVFTNETRDVNWTSLNSGMYFWNVQVCDLASNCNTTATRNYGFEIINLTLNGAHINLSVEIGTPITINATSNYKNVTIDVVHPEYGIDYITNLFSTGFELLINFFYNTLFSDGSLYKNYTFASPGAGLLDGKNFTINAHQYDEIVNLSFNIYGNTTGDNLVFYKINSTDIDRAYFGNLVGENIYINKIFDNSNGTNLYISETNISFDNEGDKLVFLYVDDNAEIIHFELNISGFEYGFEFEDNFFDLDGIDIILTDMTWAQSRVFMFKGSNLTEFVFDNFDDSSVNTDIWDKTADFEVTTNPEGGFSVIETNGYIKLYNYWLTGGGYNYNSGNKGINPKLSKFTLRDSQSIQFRLTSDYTSTADNSACSANSYVSLGGTVIWTSAIVNADYDLSNQYETTNSDIEFNLTKLDSGQWNVKISGDEVASGKQVECQSVDDRSEVIKTYDWDTGTVDVYYVDRSCDAEDDTLTIINDFNVSVSYEFIKPVYIYNNVIATNGGCEISNVDTRVYYFNNSKLYRENSSVYSESVFSSSADITSATLNASFINYAITNDTFVLYMSANDGIDWESVINGVEHNFVNPGKEIKWRVDLSTNEPGYKNSSAVLKNITINTVKEFPNDVKLDFGNDGIYEYEGSGELNGTNSPIRVNLSLAILSGAFEGSPDVGGHNYLVPLEIYSSTRGLVEISDINFTYNPNKIFLDTESIQSYISSLNDYGNMSFEFASFNGTINISNIQYDFLGGNQTIEITAKNEDETIFDKLSILFDYSRWDYSWIPTNVEWLLFLPRTTNSQNVPAYGQTSDIPLWNLTNYGYGGKDAVLSIYVNGSLDCVDLTASLDGIKSNGFTVNESWINITTLSYLETVNISVWADLSCSYSEWVVFEPEFYFRQCAEGDLCLEELI